MRLIKNKIDYNGSGTVTLCPEEPEDMVGYFLHAHTHTHADPDPNIVFCISGMPTT